jgi:hypothetical protein
MQVQIILDQKKNGFFWYLKVRLFSGIIISKMIGSRSIALQRNYLLMFVKQNCVLDSIRVSIVKFGL